MRKEIKFLTTLLLLGTSFALSLRPVSANSIYPLRQEITLSSGQRTISSVSFKNDESIPIEVLLGAYTYNPKTQEVEDDRSKVFLKLDTDTVIVNPKSTLEIRYEVYPFDNLEEGTYINVITLTPVNSSKNLSLKNSIGQLVILNLVSAENEVKGITTTDFNPSLKVIDKGIPFIKPAKIRITIQNNSNYVLQPAGAITVSTKDNQKPLSFPINQENKKLYPHETLEEDIEVKDFYLESLIFDRKVIGHFYNGLDSYPKDVTSSLNGYKFEMLLVVAGLVGLLVLTKSLKEDNKKS